MQTTILRVLVATGLVIVLTGTVPGIAQEPIGLEPTWAPGDMWTYTSQEPGKPSKIVTIIVVNVSGAGYTLRTINPDGGYELSSVPRATMPFHRGLAFSSPPPQWPLTVGQHWSGSYSCNPPECSPSAQLKFEGTVDVFEMINVPAGSFPAFRTTIQVCLD